MTRRGWTLHEMLISLGVTGAVMALAAHAATAQLRFLTNAAELSTLRSQIGHASAIAASMLWSVSGNGGDIIVAQDSAMEFHMAIGASFVCASVPGLVTMPAGTEHGNTLAAFSAPPGQGDRLLVLFDDTLGATWLTLRPTTTALVGGGCPHFHQASETRAIGVLEPLDLPVGAPLRFTRPVRLSLYRGSDRRWYLGTRDWNGESRSFNTIQPVAGPLDPYSEDESRTGLRFVYRDSTGVELPYPAEPASIASVSVVARSTSGRFNDSTAVTIALRNAR